MAELDAEQLDATPICSFNIAEISGRLPSIWDYRSKRGTYKQCQREGHPFSKFDAEPYAQLAGARWTGKAGRLYWPAKAPPAAGR
jgi:hypothetical protein